jgi:hypothetical protein
MQRQLVHRRIVMVSVAIAVALSLGVLASPAAAQDDRGPWEFTLAGTGFSDSDFDSTVLGVDLSLGYFLGPFEIGARQTINWEETDSDVIDDIWNGSTRGFLDLQFDIGSVSPFIGVMFGYVYGDLVNDQFIAGPEAGVKLHVGDDQDTFIFGRVEYQFFFEDEDEAEDAFEDGQFVYTLGVGFRF